MSGNAIEIVLILFVAPLKALLCVLSMAESKKLSFYYASYLLKNRPYGHIWYFEKYRFKELNEL